MWPIRALRERRSAFAPPPSTCRRRVLIECKGSFAGQPTRRARIDQLVKQLTFNQQVLAEHALVVVNEIVRVPEAIVVTEASIRMGESPRGVVR